MTAAMREAAALLPCPWHPTSAVNVKSQGSRFWVQCYGGCRGPAERTETQAIGEWNRRAVPVPQADDMSKKPENLGTSDEHVKDVDRVARAIQDVRGGVNYDYADFCRDAARAAIAALPQADDE